jgi:phosphonate metabolism-associated iron-containing alcohol dehydrogenase
MGEIDSAQQPPFCLETASMWQFYNPTRVICGAGSREKLVDLVEEGERVLVVCSKAGLQRLEGDAVLSHLLARDSCAIFSEVEANPDVHRVQGHLDMLKLQKFSTIVAIGGGSVIDTAKALMVGMSGDTEMRILEHIALGVKKLADPVRLIAVPTTAGTGSEVTPFATLWDHNKRLKLSLSGDAVFPTIAIVDAELSFSVPLEHSVATGLDALNQAFESIWNKNSNPYSEKLAVDAIRLSMRALPEMAKPSPTAAARTAMAQASLFAGLAISHTRTALCHSMSYPLTSHYNVPHGLACAFTMISVFELNASHDDGRICRAANLLGLADAQELCSRVVSLLIHLSVCENAKRYLPSLQSVLDIADQMYTPGRADNNLAPVDEETIKRILVSSFARDGG